MLINRRGNHPLLKIKEDTKMKALDVLHMETHPFNVSTTLLTLLFAPKRRN